MEGEVEAGVLLDLGTAAAVLEALVLLFEVHEVVEEEGHVGRLAVEKDRGDGARDLDHAVVGQDERRLERLAEDDPEKQCEHGTDDGTILDVLAVSEHAVLDSSTRPIRIFVIVCVFWTSPLSDVHEDERKQEKERGAALDPRRAVQAARADLVEHVQDLLVFGHDQDL